MKLIVTILVLTVGSYTSIAQTTPCNDSLIMSIKGTWKDGHKVSLSNEITKPVYDQMAKRADAIHKLVLDAYPQPIGCETRWNKIITGTNVSTLPWVYTYYYYTAVFDYVCIHNKPEKNGETETYFNVISNQFNNFWITTGININGQKVFTRKPILGKWNGYELYGDTTSLNVLASEILLVLSRKDMLPYKPVTRKQYLNYMIHWVDSTYTNLINNMKNSPEPQQEIITDVLNKKNRFIKLHQKELETSGAKNLLDSPAITSPITVNNFDDNTDVFTTEEKGGTVLLMVKQDYIRKDLPKYIPQFFIVRLAWSIYPSKPKIYFANMMKEKFPIEKLEAMIDK